MGGGLPITRRHAARATLLTSPAWLVVATGRASPAAPDTPARQPGYAYRREHDPDGTGHRHAAREIAQVMGHEAAGWLERPERGQEERPGDVVADLGAGTV
ncbi:MAG: hypothetical protein IT208_11320 [Chthonomonadales bacterium]|nr:hypothetical protein [Chthonomonadales bacterium]